jgi:predicted neutral ceramidase superfamily lipid hydrolase
MINTTDIVHALIPLATLLLLVVGIKKQIKNYVVVALWISVISIALQYQAAGGEILGSYFNYKQGLLYAITMLLLWVCLVYLLWGYGKESKSSIGRALTGLVVAASTTGVLLLLANLWINAQFIENKWPGSPLLQVATFTKPDYCHFRYIFYSVNKNGEMMYMCPNYYGLIPSVGNIESVPDYVLKQLPTELQAKYKKPSI